MRLFCFALVAALVLVPPPAPASDFYDQTVTSTGTSASSTALAGGVQYAMQCDAASRYRACERATCTATTNDLMLAANEVLDIALESAFTRIAVISVSGTANCRLYRVHPRTLPE